MLPQPAPMGAPPVLEPKRLKVFGVIHIVFGALGLISTMGSLLMLALIQPILGWVVNFATDSTTPSDPASKAAQEAVVATVEAMKTMFSEMALANWVQTIAGGIVAFLILLAGIALVKKRKTSLASSNRYVWCSIGAKILNLILFLAIGMGATKRYYEAIDSLSGAAAAPGPGGMDMMQFQQMFASGGTVVSLALALIYPILALVMLNKPLVKDYLSQYGR